MREEAEDIELVAGPDDSGRRLDRLLRVLLPGSGLSAIYSALRTGSIRVNGRNAHGDLRIAEGDRIALPPGLWAHPPRSADRERAGGFEALREFLVLAGHDLLFLNKPRGMLVHGRGSLEELVRAALSLRSAASLSFSPGPLHRLDRNSSGLVVFPASSAGARAFTAALRARTIRKRYLALLQDGLGGEEEWRDVLARDGARRKSFSAPASPSGGPDSAGREARSRALPLERAGGLCLAMVEIGTGLTHQIRVQASARGMPLAGDSKYGGVPFGGGYILHALSLEFSAPLFPDIPTFVRAPLPHEAARRLAAIFGSSTVEKALRHAAEA